MTIFSQQHYAKILTWMRRLGVSQKDFVEKFSCSSGKGGQNVNKVETAVALTYLPAKLSVKCHAQRTQGANRVQAWSLLLAKIQEQQKRHRQSLISKKEKLRRQKRGRSHTGKEKMLANKKIRSQKKIERSPHFYRREE